MAHLTKIEEAYQNRDCLLVGMNEIRFLPFGQSRPRCLGTANLNGCTAVMVVSRQGAILMHMSPRPGFGNPYQASGDRHAVMMMRRFQSAFGQYQHGFMGSGTYALVVYPECEGAVALEDQLNIVVGSMRALSIMPECIPYEVRPSSQRSRADGTVLIDGRVRPAQVWVEDTRVS